MLSQSDRATYAWQLDVPGFGEAGQSKLRASTALVSRVGGLGGPLAMSLAAAGFGKVVLAHAGELREDDLNRQTLMARGSLGETRVEIAAETLRRFNPEIEIEIVAENIGEDNAADLVGRADIVFDCAPLFEERFLMNRECVRLGKPLIDCAMYAMDGQVISIVPGQTPCLACIYPEAPPHWRRRFPVIGAVSALVAQIGALEGIKLLAGFGEVALGQIISIDTSTMSLDKIRLAPRRADCGVCADQGSGVRRQETGDRRAIIDEPR